MTAETALPGGLDLSCPDWFERLQDGQVPFRDLDLNEERAVRAIRVFNKLQLPDVAGHPKFEQAAGDWTRELVAAIFGSVDEDNRRWLREFLLLVPKKNSKTTSAAAIMLVALLLNERPRGEFLLIGPTQITADLAFSQAVGIIQADADGELSKILHVRDHQKTIQHRHTKATLRIKTFDKSVMTGAKPVGVLLDEIHELGRVAYAAKVLEQIRGGYEVNDEGFLIMTTTQSDEPPRGMFKDELEYARDIRDGKLRGRMLPVLYEFPLDMQADKSKPWMKPANWRLVHPNMGRTRNIESLQEAMAAAREKGVEQFDIWISQHLNIQLGIATHRNAWAGAQFWLDAADPEPITIDSLIERCEVIVAGIDGGGLDDMLALNLTGRDKTSGDFLSWSKAWIHEEAIAQRKENASIYTDFEAEGTLTVCSYPRQDFVELADIIEQVNQAAMLPAEYAIGIDPAGVEEIKAELLARGILPEQLVAIPQGYQLSGTIKGLERKLKDGGYWHDGSQLMAWSVGNAKAEQRGNATLITKQVSGTAKIDTLMASFNAFRLMAMEPQAKASQISPWDDPEFSLMAAE